MVKKEDKIATEEVEATPEVVETKPETTAKAGKRSTKAVKEVEAKQAKEERKALVTDETADVKPKRVIKPTRPRIERQGKKFQAVAKLVEKGKKYTLEEALELAQKTSPTKFDATVELHMNLSVDPRQSHQKN